MLLGNKIWVRRAPGGEEPDGVLDTPELSGGNNDLSVHVGRASIEVTSELLGLKPSRFIVIDEVSFDATVK
jgi:hypothetical protein